MKVFDSSICKPECMFAGVWLHGEAVAAGMVMAADMSYRLGWIEPEICKRTTELLKRAKQPITPPKVSLHQMFGNFHWTVCSNERFSHKPWLSA